MNFIESQLLYKIQTGFLRLRDGQVEHYHFKKKHWIVKKPNQHPESGRWRFAFGNGNRTSVYRNRIIWMLANKQEIPDTHFVDHIDGDRLNDDPGNLKLMLKEESHRQGNKRQTDPILGMLCRWFEFVSLIGREPELPSEVSWVEVGF